MGSSHPVSSHPATWKFDYPIYHADSRAELRAWFEVNAQSTPGVWLCSWKSPDLPSCPYPEVVEEAICFGWIDSTVTALDADHGLQLLTPRKPKSSWTRLNRQRAADMEAAGLMTEAGRGAVAVAQANGWWTIYDAVEDEIEPPALAAALDATPSARLAWDGFSPTARKLMLWWVISAARPDTRQRRIAEVVAKAAKGERART